jgi:hypothetical protein
MAKFKIQKHSTVNKSFKVFAPDGMHLEIQVEYDDVWHPMVDAEAEALVEFLNDNIDVVQYLVSEKKEKIPKCKKCGVILAVGCNCYDGDDICEEC